ncbi:MAG TPA: flagellar protein FliS, partial [Pirellulales bacterium]|nr:flagellar protein FliS [Pirellulales bacterium]
LTYARWAAEHWQHGRIYEGGEAIAGCQNIVTELLRGFRPEEAPELVGKVAALYNFVFGSLIEAGLKRDALKLNDAVTVLEIERETWRQVCEQLGSSLDDDARPQLRRSPHFLQHVDDLASGGFSADA